MRLISLLVSVCCTHTQQVPTTTVCYLFYDNTSVESKRIFAVVTEKRFCSHLFTTALQEYLCDRMLESLLLLWQQLLGTCLSTVRVCVYAYTLFMSCTQIDSCSCPVLAGLQLWSYRNGHNCDVILLSSQRRIIVSSEIARYTVCDRVCVCQQPVQKKLYITNVNMPLCFLYLFWFCCYEFPLIAVLGTWTSGALLELDTSVALVDECHKRVSITVTARKCINQLTWLSCTVNLKLKMLFSGRTAMWPLWIKTV